MTSPGLREQIIAIADPLLDEGCSFAQVNNALFLRLGIRMGKGGGGAQYDRDAAPCRYCEAYGNGGHGGFCPNGGGW